MKEEMFYPAYDDLVHDSTNFSRSNLGSSGSVITAGQP